MATDFALTPIGGAAIAGSFGGLLKARPNTKLLGPEPPEDTRSLLSFLRAIDNLETDDISNLVIVSHAAPSGAFALQLTDDFPFNSLTQNYDTLTKALGENPLVVRASGGIVNRAEPNAAIIVKGCELGRSPKFMALLQRAIGPTFRVIASLYPHCAGQDPENKGWMEFMKYEFHQDYFLSQDNDFDALDKNKVKALTRGRILADMKARNSRFDGSSFPDSAWEAMIPKQLPALKPGKIPKPIYNPFGPEKQVAHIAAPRLHICPACDSS
jgi:hypothetical protein